VRYGSENSKTRKYSQNTFNPDFFIKVIKNDVEYFVVVEIKADKDESGENKAKYKYAKEHFERLNKKLEEGGIKQKYIFHFLSPEGYTTFFEYLKDGRILDGQEKFRCELENLLEEDN
jgi:type III restriction enzyme